MTSKDDGSVSVRVAVRIRPQNAREKLDMCRKCVTCYADQFQVVLGKDKAFTYDFVFDENICQQQIYDTCVESLIESCFDGYNATVLAYGQTGSGKTYSMGTAFDVNVDPEIEGIIPRAVNNLFNGINIRKQKAAEENLPSPEFNVTAQFLELYNEEIIDLLSTTRNIEPKVKKNLKIHESQDGDIYVAGATSRTVTSPDDTAKCLQDGTLLRTTASTNMNAQSSRSHAIFTISIRQTRFVKTMEQSDELESISAKFHFVDLAGSERLKRTGATGDRAKEGISINCGLLSLGNVISALGDQSKKATHVPYRDSKLTRFLQDSLGGNSRTLMIACASPSDCDFMETLNTLKYANRARNIKNKVVVNQDQASKQIAALRAELQQLRIEVMEYRQGKRVAESDGEPIYSDLHHENVMLQAEVDRLRSRIKAMQQVIDSQKARNISLEVNKATEMVVADPSNSLDISKVIEKYVAEIENLKIQLAEIQEMRRWNEPTSSTVVLESSISSAEILKIAKQSCEEDMQKMKDIEKSDDSDSQDDSENEDGELTEDVAKLSQEISVKQRLISELESSHEQINMLKAQYEEKVVILQKKIEDAKTERDQIMKTIDTLESGSGNKANQVKSEYEKKINNLTTELTKLKTAQKEHNKLLKIKTQHEQQLLTLRTDLQRMKEAKVKLVNQMKQDASRNKQEGVKKNREIAKLKKLNRQKEIAIRNLESDKQRREAVLKRKQGEVEVLRREKKQMQPAVIASQEKMNRSGISLDYSRTSKRTTVAKISTLAGISSKKKWKILKDTLSNYVANKQALLLLESDIEDLMQEREKLGLELENCKKQMEEISGNDSVEKENDDLHDRAEGIVAKLEFIQDTISERQNEVMHLTEAKEEHDPTAIVNSCNSILNAKSLLENLIWEYANKRIIMCEQEKSNRRLKEKLASCENQIKLQETFLKEHLQSQDSLDLYVSECTLLSRQPFKSPDKKNKKHRRKTFSPNELMFIPDTRISTKNLESLYQERSNVIEKSSDSHGRRESDSYPYNRTSSMSSNSRDGRLSVFERLTPDIGTRESDRGKFVAIKSSTSNNSNSAMNCVYEARGHTSAVLCLDCTKDLLFSASKDGTVKMWDTGTGQEITTLGKGYVKDLVAMQFSENLGLLFIANKTNITVWDPRENPDRCIHMLSLTNTSISNGGVREVSAGRQINDIKIISRSEQLISTDGNFLRIWDIRKFNCITKLITNHKAAITTVAIADNATDNSLSVATGSKDHSIKLLHITNSGSDIQYVKHDLEPPHYDGVQAVKIVKDQVFSSSRDSTIKQWNTTTCEFVQSQQSANKDWVTTLNYLPSRERLISGCRSGALHLWDIESLACVENFKAHPHCINSIVVSCNYAFTSSSDGIIKVWSINESS